MTTRIKICGITNIDDACCAAEAGADFLGFVFYAPSPRFVTAQQAAAIVRGVRGEFGARAPRSVGVFVDESVAHVEAVLEAVGLDLAQLHGSESPAEVQRLLPRAFKALRPRTREEAEAAVAAYASVVSDDQTMPQFLIDAYHPQQFGGTGLPADLALAASLAHRFRLLLAGGLAPETVGPAVERVRPWGVDVSSGVERARGLKDHVRIRAFVEAVRAIETTKERHQ
jgi:phosphoribosylanthranilate isomerase